MSGQIELVSNESRHLNNWSYLLFVVSRCFWRSLLKLAEFGTGALRASRAWFRRWFRTAGRGDWSVPSQCAGWSWVLRKFLHCHNLEAVVRQFAARAGSEQLGLPACGTNAPFADSWNHDWSSLPDSLQFFSAPADGSMDRAGSEFPCQGECQLAQSAIKRGTNGRILSGHAVWLQWHATSTSALPASRHESEQYSIPLATWHRHGMCAHTPDSWFAITNSSFPTPSSFRNHSWTSAT